ncbi:MAG: DUF3861 domain-containing protein [Zoogloeaceae bacterium]|jgi:hypothetical protein|nr:DUF3861 domain-containing protein [Zoogloeaceae bacterium]
MATPKKGCRYRVTLEELDADTPARLQFEFDNHDDIFAIVERLRGRDGDPVAAGEVPPFVLGLKLLGRTLMANRQHPLFADFFPRFADFMKALKKGA